ncbi:P27 family phage terminase small subunit [Staphylococcus pasteuri]|uniref:P27 family phage terminase small subunit n=1 Tax=Staphylococcus pasteuri TaxID=45972 RepID=UPI002DB88D3A|nr:P27 family phage terminase small subunit [Staphylococcus pasteuri]MEB6208193.1 P27 family phage terminase small subunit [Staphylococcus pasteuri]
MGRPRKLNAVKTGHHTKEELEQAQLVENGLFQFEPISVKSVPKDLPPQAQKEWLRIVPLLKELPISDLDYMLVKRYCEIICINDNAYEKVKEQGMYHKDTEKVNEHFKVYIDTLNALKNIATSLGITMDTRNRFLVINI